MNILKSTEGLSKKDLYNLTRSPEIKKMSDVVGQEINVEKYLLREDLNNAGEDVSILSIMDETGAVYATNSMTAQSEFEYILDLMAGDPFTVKVVQGTSKAGRTYITLVLK